MTAETTTRHFQPEVGMGVSLCGWSDVHAYTVVGVSASGKSFEIQRDKATLLNGVNSGEPDALRFQAGGFCGHTSGRQRRRKRHRGPEAYRHAPTRIHNAKGRYSPISR